MPISWNEIRHNAISFARDWAGAKSESAERQTFWNEFFKVFGIRRRFLAVLEMEADDLVGNHDRIHLFWPGVLIVEHKSPGKDLDDGDSLAHRYIASLASAGRDDEVPRYVIVSNFTRISLLDLEPDDPIKRTVPGGYRIEFSIGDLHRHIRDFAFILGNQQHHNTGQGWKDN
jgi:hypothetical protein